MDDHVNPASNLHDILFRTRRRMLELNDSGQVALKWVLEHAAPGSTLPSDDDEADLEEVTPALTSAEFFGRVAEIAAMPARIIRSLEAVEAHELVWARDALQRVSEAFGRLLTASWNQAGEIVTEDVLLALKGASAALDHSIAAQRRLPDDVLRSLREESERLRSMILDDDSLPPELRRFLLDSLFDIDMAVGHYELTGLEGLQRVLQTIAGRYMNDERAQTKPGFESAVWGGFKAFLSGLDRVVRYATFGLALTSNPSLPWVDVQPTPAVVEHLPPIGELETGPIGEIGPATSTPPSADE